MKTDTMISIIVPMYNPDILELEQCLDSIGAIKQEIEVILINDGSLQKEIKRYCLEYMKKDHRFQYHYQPNKGVSAARNYGLSFAKGKFVSFVDADDCVDSLAINHIDLKSLENIDLVLFDVLEINTVQERKTRELFPCETGLIPMEEVKKCFIHTSKLSECWGKLYRTEVVKKDQIKFPEEIKQGEDAIFNSRYLQHCSKAYYNKTVFYQYHITLSNTTQRFIKSPLNRLSDELSIYKNIVTLIENSDNLSEKQGCLKSLNYKYTDGFGSRLLLLSKHNLINNEIKDYIRKEVKPLICKDSISIFDRKPKTYIYNLIIRCNFWFAFKVLGCFKHITI